MFLSGGVPARRRRSPCVLVSGSLAAPAGRVGGLVFPFFLWGWSCVRFLSVRCWLCCWFGRGVLVCPCLVSVCVRVRPGGLVCVLLCCGRVRSPVGAASPGGVSWVRRASFRRVLVGLCACRVRAALAVRGGVMAASLVGFSGSRALSPAFAPLARRVVASVVASGRGVAVGCAPGLDAVVRSACPSAVVFSAASFGVGRSSFARRSVALVSACSALVVFPASPCPSGLVPSASSSACFCGLGSGSWASAAFAAGLGLPVVVFPCGFSALPAWGSWVVAGSGCWASGFRLVAPAQPALF